MTNDGEITALLAALRNGDPGALDRLFPVVYDELRQRAHYQLARQRPGDTFSTTALVHEAYLKLAGSQGPYHDRVHFLAVASRAMRQILIDYARYLSASKRDGGERVSLDSTQLPDATQAEELLALDEALNRLASLDARLAHTVELRFFGGLSVEETADVLAVSARTVKRDWRKARAFLYDAVTNSNTTR